MTLRPCPGGCGTPIPGTILACSTCWAGVPEGIRAAADRTLARLEVTAYLDARLAALRWFEERASPAAPAL